MARSLPLLGGRLRELLDPAARDRALVEVGESLKRGRADGSAAGTAGRVLFVDYLTLLPPPGRGRTAAIGRRRRARPPRRRTLERLTGRGRRGNRLRAGAGRGGQPRARRVVGRPLDDQADEIRRAAARAARRRCIPMRPGFARAVAELVAAQAS